MNLRKPHLPSLPKSRKGRVLLGAALFIVCALAAGGGYFWVRHSQYLASPVYAVDSLNEAIQNRDAKLFETVFPPGVSEDFALKLTGTLPPASLTQTDPAILAQDMREYLMTLLKNEPAPKFTKGHILPMLPEDFFQQLAEKPFLLRKADVHLAVAETSFYHPSCKKELKLNLALGRTGGRWSVVGVLNARELLSTYLVALNEEQQRLEHLREDKQALHARKMVYYLPDALCTAGPMRISGGHPVLVLSMKSAPNPGPEIVEGWGLEFPLTDDEGTTLLCPRLTESGKLMAGNGLRRSWTIDLEEDTYRRLTAAETLHCRVAPLYVLLDNGTMYSQDPHWSDRVGHGAAAPAHH